MIAHHLHIVLVSVSAIPLLDEALNLSRRLIGHLVEHGGCLLTKTALSVATLDHPLLLLDTGAHAVFQELVLGCCAVTFASPCRPLSDYEFLVSLAVFDATAV